MTVLDKPLAVLTTAVATHRLYKRAAGYVIDTELSGGETITGPVLTTREAMEWIETTKRCGGTEDSEEA